MTIGTTNVSFSAIASEFSLANTNLSLQDLGKKQVILNPGNSRQTYTLTDSLALNSEDTATADNMNMGGANNYEMSEFKSYDMAEIVFSADSLSGASIGHYFENSGGCIASINMSGAIHCSRSSNDLVFQISEGNWSSLGTHTKENSSGNYANTEVARLAGIGADTSTTVSVSYTQVTNNDDASVAGSSSALAYSSTSGNLVSTNSKYGLEFRYQGLIECVTSGYAYARQGFKVHFDVTHPDYRARRLSFHCYLKGRGNTTFQNCC